MTDIARKTRLPSSGAIAKRVSPASPYVSALRQILADGDGKSVATLAFGELVGEVLESAARHRWPAATVAGSVTRRRVPRCATSGQKRIWLSNSFARTAVRMTKQLLSMVC
jgi:hypothetical protein